MEIAAESGDEASLAPGAYMAAIDVGSNAMRLGIALRDDKGGPNIILRHREPVRLGHDAFTTGRLSEATQNEAILAFRQFRRILDRHHVGNLRATATSAMRDSENGPELAKRILEDTGIQLDLISGEEEARLVYLSIATRVDLDHHFALLIDIGGGSVEVTLSDDSQIVASQSFRIGTVRLLEMLGTGGNFNLLLREYLDGMRSKLRTQIGRRKVDLCIGTGGNCVSLGELGLQLGLSASSTEITRKSLKKLIKHLSKLPVEERIRDLGLRPDRADVILPAAMVLQEIMSVGKATSLRTPDAGLLDGILLDMVAPERKLQHSRRISLLGWARSAKKKYQVDNSHALAVTRLALDLFAQTGPLHGLGEDEKLLLEVAACVHEIGMYVRVGRYHRHAAYLIMAAPLLGLSVQERTILAETVHYQRKSFPSATHEAFAGLGDAAKKKVWAMSALLRLAIALNKDRRDRVHNIVVDCDDKTLILHIEGRGDLLLERWAVLQVADYIKQAFGRNLQIDLNLAGEIAEPRL
ncbi:MAG: exopolyphosphatase [Zetaproteobacteria bacterium CG1_02_53_45]|nr:MAG: exopolyphosphatase [Zetaproteobacteria bacterium CG1_02_53_45]